MDVAEEKYSISIFDEEGLLKRQAFSFEPSFLYTSEMQASDLINLGLKFSIEVAQLGDNGIFRLAIKNSNSNNLSKRNNHG